ncbi:MAG TPA: hypothetical protein DCQ26_16030 [Marinilabiliales bacterium]|jgi:hypothetical protein|nr:MAG: hypothetical protein A2W84_05265 [Bacteroidetes bacterium GWC2_40_13]OFX75450.1 MAG: hypothetical protein A2W96_08305 [Bacteroidetes bacterium GWD2_40_43]OFX93965.1 MAG: hypothetical protein A2W97_14230 [Bacteroidetes bacterium GWE2_40_63]OFY19754.1 MAG: hypothetical protein A2W88_03100 [Bacteroidetes bacterium GWF2_40_13]OFZ24526.1 MAG: hypothetical protein A2437_01285 [Bacteroidetes bacterium RIFOXYC2_FULL_40_12]HAN00108.1 hypothetical protein [Marinilabiliales bacterium]
MEDNLFDKLREMTGMVPERFSILEQQIDVKLQMEYFKYSKKLKKDIKKEQPIDPETINLYEPEYTNDALKELLVKLASLDNPKAFRVIEDYTKNGRPELLDWSVLAMQENKMLLESSLLNENQVFISTGLGGKGTMLRYFVVLIGADLNEFAEFQRKIITSEFDFSLKNSQSELEQIDFFENYATMLVLIPFEVAFQNVFKTALEECNQFGNFLKPNFLVTNVKVLSKKEIKDFVEKNELPDADKLDQFELDTNDDEA